MKSYVVIGLGRFGRETALQLSRMGNEVLAIDTDSENIQHVASEVTQAVIADGRDKEVLRTLGVANFDCGLVAIGNDLSASVLATMNLKELGVPYVVCKAFDETHRRVLQKLGADRVIIPEQEQATRLARSLSSPNVLDYIELSSDCGIVEIPAPAGWVGKTLKNLNVRAKLGVNIIAIRQGTELSVSPGADYEIGRDDVMVVLGDNHQLAAVQKL